MTTCGTMRDLDGVGRFDGAVSVARIAPVGSAAEISRPSIARLFGVGGGTCTPSPRDSATGNYALAA